MKFAFGAEVKTSAGIEFGKGERIRAIATLLEKRAFTAPSP